MRSYAAGSSRETPEAPRRALFTSPYPLAGFAQAGERDGTRESKAENGYWGRSQARRPLGRAPARGGTPSLSLRSLSQAEHLRVGAPLHLSPP